MKICIISYYFLETTLPLAKNLAEQGNDVTVYVLLPLKNRNAPIIDYTKFDVKYGFNDDLELANIDERLKQYVGNVRVTPFFYNGGFTKKYHEDIIGSFRMRKRLFAENYDKIHLIGGTPFFVYLHVIMGAKIAVHTLHEVNAHEGKTGFWMSRLLDTLGGKLETKIIVHSTASRERLSKYYDKKNQTRGDIFYIPFGLFETYQFADNEEIEEEEHTILFWGRILPYKGLDILLQAFTLVLAEIPDAKLIVAGDGETGIISFNHHNFELYNKQLDTGEIIELNKRAAVIICPYLSASQSGIPMTTFLFGKPIIASNVGGFKEMIEDGKTGILIEKRNPEMLAEKIVKLLNDSELRKRMNENIVEKYVNGDSALSWKNIAEKTMTVYEKV
jgi:glycosyltransferase involved in cell wall biosynthesis